MLNLTTGKEKWKRSKEILAEKRPANNWFVLSIGEKSTNIAHVCLIKFLKLSESEETEVQFFDGGQNGQSDIEENITENYYWNIFDYKNKSCKNTRYIVTDEDLIK